MKFCPVCKSDESEHIIIKDMKIGNPLNVITHEAEECHVCKVCGVAFFVNIKEIPKNS